MSNTEMDFLDRYIFHFLQDVSQPHAQLHSVGYEERYSGAYHHENSQREPGYLLQYTISGEGMVRVGTQIHIARPGTAILLSFPSDSAYWFDETQSTAPWRFYYVVFFGTGLAPYIELLQNRQGILFELSECHPAIRELIYLQKQAKEGHLQDPFLASKSVFEIVCSLCSEPPGHGVHSRLTEEALNYLQLHFARPIGIADVCTALKVSPAHLSRVFCKEMGMQPIYYLTRLRLEEATRLLNNTNLPIDIVSSRCGFGSSNYFSKVFRRHLKLSPSAFRSQMRAQKYQAVQL